MKALAWGRSWTIEFKGITEIGTSTQISSVTNQEKEGNTKLFLALFSLHKYVAFSLSVEKSIVKIDPYAIIRLP